MKYGILLLFVVAILGCPESKYSSCEKAANRYCPTNVSKEKTVKRDPTTAEFNSCMNSKVVRLGGNEGRCYRKRDAKVSKSNEEYAEDLESCIASSIMRCVQKSR
tara:strand:+ start:253 stop:567 length:315 start_codon:yes stop_codon:yes gene_type:complete